MQLRVVQARAPAQMGTNHSAIRLKTFFIASVLIEDNPKSALGTCSKKIRHEGPEWDQMFSHWMMLEEVFEAEIHPREIALTE